MSYLGLIVIVISLLALFVIVGTYTLLLSAKLFKVENLHFRRILKIHLLLGTVGLIIIVPGLLFLPLLLLIPLVTVYILRRSLHVSWVRSIGIMLVNGILTWIIATAMTLLLNSFVFQAFQVDGNKNTPALNQGDRIITSKPEWIFAGQSYTPTPGQLIVFMKNEEYRIGRIDRISNDGIFKVTYSNSPEVDYVERDHVVSTVRYKVFPGISAY